MKFILEPWHLMSIIVVSWANRQRQEVIEYLRTENAVLKEKLAKKRILLNEHQRRRLAVKEKSLAVIHNTWLGRCCAQTEFAIDLGNFGRTIESISAEILDLK